eukprot:s1477_g11.t1
MSVFLGSKPPTQSDFRPILRPKLTKSLWVSDPEGFFISTADGLSAAPKPRLRLQDPSLGSENGAVAIVGDTGQRNCKTGRLLRQNGQIRSLPRTTSNPHPALGECAKSKTSWVCPK